MLGDQALRIRKSQNEGQKDQEMPEVTTGKAKSQREGQEEELTGRPGGSGRATRQGKKSQPEGQGEALSSGGSPTGVRLGALIQWPKVFLPY